MGGEEVEKIARVVKKHLSDATIILFGSRARGDHLKHSDIDMIIISKKFEGVKFTDRASLVLKILDREEALPKVGLDILCYTPEEAERKKKEISIVREALRYGLTLSPP